ncbi:MAG: insulinase family protein [Bacteroidales bacterium]|jgi:zinc protease|nr:insulinase family protein [Bacteroidales bacterium]
MKKFFLQSCVLTGLVLGSIVLYSQNTVVDLTTPIANDPVVKTGKLENGLVYYIRQNKKPEKRIELRLVVNAGSILENDDQRGLAHFMEHMNFNGTKTFPKNELIDFLQKTGVRFGADINAYTSFDETVYMLQLPTDDSTLVEKGYQVLEDWAHNALLDDKEIDKERGVIVEEWRLGLGAQDRMMKKFFPVIFKDSRYAERLPIGKVEVIENFKHETLRDFYHDWYRPDLQAIVVVGDVDPTAVEARIKQHFSALANPEQPRERKAYTIPANAEPLIAVTTDKEATNNVVLIFYKHPSIRLKTIADFRYHLMAQLFTGMLDNRLGEISQKPESPYIYAGSNYGKFLARTNDAYILTALSKENEIDSSLLTILEENERVKKFGFTSTEFERQKEEILSKYDKASKEYDKTESAKFTGEYVDNYLSGNAYPSARKQLLYVIHLLPDIKLEEINALAGAWVTDTNMAMVVMAPDKENVKVPTKEKLNAVVNQSVTSKLEPYVDKFREEPLVNKELQPGSILNRIENKELGFTELQLSNGVTVVLKPTTFKNDEILVSAYSLGGHSLYPDKDFMSANYSSQVISMSGAGNFDNIELEKKLKGKNLQVNPYIEDVRQGLRGNSTPKDFEALLQLIYLYFEEPRKDSSAFEAFMSQMSNQMKFMKSSPVMTFYDTLFKSVYPGYKRLVVFPSETQLNEVKLDDIYRIYKDRFADASGVKFFIVGNINIDSITPLLTKYLGSLPSLNRKETWKDVSPQFPQKITNLTFNMGTDPQSMVGLVFSKKVEWTQQNLLALSMLKEILSIKLVEVIREKLSGVYSPQVILNPDHYPQSQFQLIIMFGCSPTTTGKLTKAVLGEIKKLRKKGPTPVDLKKAQESLIRERETNLEKNEFWQGKLESIFYDNTDPASILNFRDRVNAMTVQDLRKTFEAMLDPGNYVNVVLKPEKK